jgi:eukaryotic-like serine/threonine-protein kinase
MAPEQIEPGARGILGPASDVWGLGVSLFEALAGGLPFGPSTEDDRFPQLHRPRTTLSADVPPLLKDIVEWSLVPDPSGRPTARQVHDALGPLVAALPKRPVIGRLKPRLG